MRRWRLHIGFVGSRCRRTGGARLAQSGSRRGVARAGGGEGRACSAVAECGGARSRACRTAHRVARLADRVCHRARDPGCVAGACGGRCHRRCRQRSARPTAAAARQSLALGGHSLRRLQRSLAGAARVHPRSSWAARTRRFASSRRMPRSDLRRCYRMDATAAPPGAGTMAARIGEASDENAA